MKIPLYQVDAFTKKVFSGNPAAVCPLDRWLPDAQLLAVAAENNLSETAFFISREGHYELRWFTPTQEVDLCGHATLATGFVLFECFGVQQDELLFKSRSGPLRVLRDEGRYILDFPRWEPGEIPGFEALDALGATPQAVFTGGARDYIALFASEEEVRGLDPFMEALLALDRRGVIATAPGESSDFVLRYFAPGLGVPEDPATGSALCSLAPLWAARLGRTRLRAVQRSKRGGELFCELKKDRVLVSGHAVKYLEGLIEVPALPAGARGSGSRPRLRLKP